MAGPPRPALPRWQCAEASRSGTLPANSRNQRAAEQAQLRRFRERGAVLERVVSGSFDGVENRETTAAEKFKIDSQGCVDCSVNGAPAAKSSRVRAISDFISAT